MSNKAASLVIDRIYSKYVELNSIDSCDFGLVGIALSKNIPNLIKLNPFLLSD
jgi:hypothetical protein